MKLDIMLTIILGRIWGISEDTVNHSQAGNVFMLGPGGLATIILAAYFGRLPVLFYFVIIAFLTIAWCAAATSFDSFMTARVLNGFFSTVAQGVSSCPVALPSGG